MQPVAVPAGSSCIGVCVGPKSERTPIGVGDHPLIGDMFLGFLVIPAYQRISISVYR